MRIPAVLILGPTGAGKTPLGEYWQDHGLAGRRCRHFDFGARLRAEAGLASRLSPSQVEVIRRVLRTGALLEDAEFPIALAVLESFIREESLGNRDILILNGLPRHTGQAAGLANSVDIRAVVKLEAAPEIIRTRIRTNAGGDRAGRADDDAEAVAARLRLFEARTAPLEDFYRDRGVRILDFGVGLRTPTWELARVLAVDLEGLFAPAATPST
jgi:adenylate kinase